MTSRYLSHQPRSHASQFSGYSRSPSLAAASKLNAYARSSTAADPVFSLQRRHGFGVRLATYSANPRYVMVEPRAGCHAR